VVLILTILFCRKVIINANLIARFWNLQIDSIFITLVAGLVFIALLAFIFSVWIIREPKTETNKEEELQGQEVGSAR